MHSNSNELVIAVDFDGTVVEHAFPDMGRDAPGAATVLRELTDQGSRIVLWTMRSGAKLDEAAQWFADHDIPLYGVQINPGQKSWTDSPKAYAHLYIDDAAFGAPLIHMDGWDRPVLDWRAVRTALLDDEIE